MHVERASVGERACTAMPRVAGGLIESHSFGDWKHGIRLVAVAVVVSNSPRGVSMGTSVDGGVANGSSGWNLRRRSDMVHG